MAPVPAPPPAAPQGYPYGAPCNTADYVQAAILRPKCSMCHSTRPLAPTDLDVVTPGLRGRLNNRVARTCIDRRLVVTEPTLGGYLLEKLTAAPGICGGRMPAVGPALPADEIECIRTWLRTTR